MKCPKCGGSGNMALMSPGYRCNQCKGEGEIVSMRHKAKTMNFAMNYGPSADDWAGFAKAIKKGVEAFVKAARRFAKALQECFAWVQSFDLTPLEVEEMLNAYQKEADGQDEEGQRQEDSYRYETFGRPEG